MRTRVILATRLFVCSIISSVALLVVPNGAAQVERPSIERLVDPYLEADKVVGMTISIVTGEGEYVFGFGTLTADGETQPDGDTVYEIGSESKVFTGILLANAVNRGDVQLDQIAQELLPDEVQLVINEKPILLKHLSTHASGLPSMPSNFRPADPENPFADYSVERLHEFLHEHKPPRAPEQKAEYSNLAVGLLGHLLERTSGMSYEALLKEHITEPLDMHDTAITLTEEMKARLATPHLGDGTPTKNWDIPTLAGAGAIRSTGNDMLRFIKAQLEPPGGALGEAIDLAWKKHWDPSDPNAFDMGLGWHIAHDGQTRWHNGQTGGYHSMMLVNRPRGIGVSILCNSATFEIDALAESIIRMLGGQNVEPRAFEQPDEMEIAPEKLPRYAGKYQLAPGAVLTFEVKSGKLFAQLTGQPSFRVFPKSESEWFYKVVDAQLTFEFDDEGNCTQVTLHQSGRDMPAKRIDD